MQLISYCEKFPSRSELEQLIEKGWLSPQGEPTFHQQTDLRDLLNAQMALNLTALSDEIGGPNTLVLIDLPLSNQENCRQKNTNHVLSTVKFKNKFNLLAGVCFCYLRMKHSDVLGKCDVCLFEESRRAWASISNTYEEELCNLGHGDDAVRLRILSVLLQSYNQEEVSRYLSNHFSLAISEISPEFLSVQAKICASNIVIDNFLAPGSNTRNWLKGIALQVANHGKRIKKYYSPRRDKLPKHPFLITNRHWNSWTPSQPRSTEKYFDISTNKIKRGEEDFASITPSKSHGGGYLLSDGKTIIAVDPGFGFVDMLYRFNKISVMDIDAVIITHDHPDHSADFQSILALRYIYRKNCNNKLTVWLNQSSYRVYRELLGYYKDSLLTSDSPCEIIPDPEPRQLGNFFIRTMGMFHREIFSGNTSALGLDIHGISNEEEPFRIIIPGDTSFPTESKDIHALVSFFGFNNENPSQTNNTVKVSQDQIAQKCDLARRPDIAAFHIGSLEEGWQGEDASERGPDKVDSSKDKKASLIEYGTNKHLGLNGIIKMLNLLKPKVATITEYGEELEILNSRLALNEIVSSRLLYKDAVVIPADASLYLSIDKQKILFKCTNSNCSNQKHLSFVPVEFISVLEGDDNFIDYLYPAGCQSNLNHATFNIPSE